MAKYKTQISYGEEGKWHEDTDLTIEIKNRNSVVPASGLPAIGTQVSWSSAEGSGAITFFDDKGANAFHGSAQFPKEGPVGYRGQLIK